MLKNCAIEVAKRTRMNNARMVALSYLIRAQPSGRAFESHNSYYFWSSKQTMALAILNPLKFSFCYGDDLDYHIK